VAGDRNGIGCIDLDLSSGLLSKWQDERRRFTGHARQIDPSHLGHSVNAGGGLLACKIHQLGDQPAQPSQVTLEPSANPARRRASPSAGAG
jgi:hypothetical protein